MGNTDSDDVKHQGQEVGPVMFCQTADGGDKTLVRGQAPSTPRQRRKEKRRLTALMFFRCTPEERTVIETNASVTGLEKSTYMRSQCIGKPVIRAYRRIRLDWDRLREYMGLLNKAGNVVNQHIVMERQGSLNPDAAKAESRRLAHKAFADISQVAQLIAGILRGH